MNIYLDIRILKWKMDGIIVAGGNDYGEELDHLWEPLKIYIDDNENLYITDTAIDRIVKWKKNARIGEIIAGGNGRGNQLNQLNGPINFVIDHENKFIFICDQYNNRIVNWPIENGTKGEIIISNIDYLDLTFDNDDYLYVSDWYHNEVRKWKIGDENGILVAGGNGRGDKLNQLDFPYNIFVDKNYSIYISDYGNHRVIKWIKGAKEGVAVAGTNGGGNSLEQLHDPQGIFVDQFETVYIADTRNSRIIRWLEGAKQGDIIVSKELNGYESIRPYDLSFDRENNLYVVDLNKPRVIKYLIDELK